MGAAARTRLAKTLPARASLGVLVASRAASVRMAMVDLSGIVLGWGLAAGRFYSGEHSLMLCRGDVVGASSNTGPVRSRECASRRACAGGIASWLNRGAARS